MPWTLVAEVTDFFEFYTATVGAYVEDRRARRLGQVCFDALYDVRPDIADRIQGTDADPFFDDDRIPAFWDAVIDHWEDL